MNWNEIKTQNDIDGLLDRFRNFLESCIHEAYIETGCWVAKDRSKMRFSCAADTIVRIHFQSSIDNPCGIELLFEEVIRFNFVSVPEGYDSTIYKATLLLLDGTFFWSDASNWSPNDPEADDCTWISARKLHWREVNNWLGEELQYGPKEIDNDT